MAGSSSEELNSAWINVINKKKNYRLMLKNVLNAKNHTKKLKNYCNFLFCIKKKKVRAIKWFAPHATLCFVGFV